MFKWLAAALVGAAVLTAQAFAQPVPAEAFARSPNVWSGRISPDGRYIAAIQRVAQGDALVVIDWRTRQARAIQLARADRALNLDWVSWKSDNRLLFVIRQRANFEAAETTGTRMSGRRSQDEQFDITRVFAVNADGSGLTQMFEGQTRRLAASFVPVVLIDALPRDPNNVLLGTYGLRGYGLYRADVNTGRADEIATGSWETNDFEVDGAGNAVLRTDLLPNNSGYQIFRRGPGQSRWELAHEYRRASVAQGREFQVLGPGPGAGQVYVAARPDGQEYQAIYLYDAGTGALGAPVFAHPNADAAGAWFNSSSNALIIGCAELIRLECRAADPAMQRHFEAINTFFAGEAVFTMQGTSADGAYWLLYVTAPTIPGVYYVYDVANTHIAPVAPAYPQIPGAALSSTEVVNYTARDGVQLWGYLTRPGNANAQTPLVVLPHGGPESRDSYGYDMVVQFLASRGYAVFQPNFRGSEGSGRRFAEAGYRQWGRLMQDDVTDGVRHLIGAGVVDAQRICIAGISYGGYSALAGVSLTPDLYRCAISIAGDSDLIELLDLERQASGRGSTSYAYWQRIIGDANTDRDALIAVSPRRQVANITAPVLLIHGTQDEIVFARQSEGMREAMERAGKSVRYVAIEGEGHPWRYWQERNVRTVLEETERFLAQHLPAQ
ncbi:MAG: alpha/beta hydrolase family protein [Hyphomonadaceae bacterium]